MDDSRAVHADSAMNSMQHDNSPNSIQPARISLTPANQLMTRDELDAFNAIDETDHFDHLFALVVASSDLSANERLERIVLDGTEYVFQRHVVVALHDASGWPGRFSGAPGTRHRLSSSIACSRDLVTSWFNTENTAIGRYIVERDMNQLKALKLVWNDPAAMAEYYARYTLLLVPPWIGNPTPPAVFVTAWCVAQYSLTERIEWGSSGVMPLYKDKRLTTAIYSVLSKKHDRKMLSKRSPEVPMGNLSKKFAAMTGAPPDDSAGMDCNPDRIPKAEREESDHEDDERKRKKRADPVTEPNTYKGKYLDLPAAELTALLESRDVLIAEVTSQLSAQSLQLSAQSLRIVDLRAEGLGYTIRE
jgi:hypothetical protein